MPAKKRATRPQLADERSSIWDNRTRVIALGMAVFAVALVLWSLHKSAPAPVAASGGPGDSATPQAGQGGSLPGMFGMNLAPASPSAAPSAGPADPPPVIDEVQLEKKEVCSGEENLVTVKSHTTNGTDPYLHTVIDGHMGNSVPITLWKDPSGNIEGSHSITVFGRGNVATTVPLPQYEVMDCRPTYIAEIMQRVRSNTWADFDFNARVIGIQRAPTEADRQRGAGPPPTPKPFKPISFTWTFGDGEGATTLTPIVEHDYEGRSQSSLYSYFVVSVSIRGAKGETATGRMSLPLINPAFESLASKGIVSLLIALDPRFPELGSDGKVTQKVRIWHTQPGPVTIERASLVKFYRKAAGQTPATDVDVAGLLGTTTIPAGKDGITTTVTLNPEAEEEVFSKTWALNGTSAEGYPAMGTFSVMVPPPKPSADAGDTVFDPMLKQKIILARKMLGKDTVTDEDLWRLDREGAFTNLKVTPQEAAAAASAAIAAAQQKGPPRSAANERAAWSDRADHHDPADGAAGTRHRPHRAIRSQVSARVHSTVRALLFSLALFVPGVAGCRSSAGSSAGCKAGEPFCWCPAGASCSQTCTGPSCALYCANGNAACTLHGGDGCSASCQNAQSCSASCGKASTVACQYVKGSCTATVGEASRVHCEGAALCDITCTGACDVDCPGGHCRVHCADPASCSLACDKAPSATAACADPAIKVCSAPCG